MRMLIMGPPGAGKGTQATVIAQKFGIAHISTGDLFRANLSAGTPLGLEAKKFMDAGEYVPDSVTNDMVRDRLTHADAANGFLLDGYPRTLAQVTELDEMLGEAKLDQVLVLTADSDAIVARLLNRAAEQSRTDDTENVIRRRLEVYEEQTAPLIDLYSKRGILVEVDGLGTREEVADRIFTALSR